MRSPGHQLPITGRVSLFEAGAKHVDRVEANRKVTTTPPSQALQQVMDVLRSICQPSPAWVATLVVLIIDGGWIVLGGWTVPPSSVATTGGAFAAFLTPLCFDRYRDDVRISGTLRVGALLILFTGATAILSYLVVSTNANLVDARLAAWDRSIGFDWLTVLQWMQAHPSIHASLGVAYGSGLPQMAFVVVFLGFTARSAQLNEFMCLYFAAVLVVVALSWPFPAAGPWAHYSLSAMLDASSMSHFHLLRDGSLRTLDLKEMQGLISIPSLHTALAMILVYAMRGTRLFSGFVLLNGLMILATPIEGGHYLVDVLAGAVLALTLIAFSRFWVAGAFRRSRP